MLTAKEKSLAVWSSFGACFGAVMANIVKGISIALGMFITFKLLGVVDHIRLLFEAVKMSAQ